MTKLNTNSGSYGDRYINKDRTKEVYPNYQDETASWETSHDEMIKLGFFRSELPLRITMTTCKKCQGKGCFTQDDGMVSFSKRCDRCEGTRFELQDIS